MKRLILLGGGHAHVKVLADLAQQPLAGWDVHLVTPYHRQIYSGMLPGWIAGHYPIEACAIKLDALASSGAVVFHETSGVSLDLEQSALRCADGSGMRFDVLSIDTGPMPALQGLPGSAQHALPVRPIERFIAAWPKLVERILGQCRRFDLVILGAGAAGVELAFAIQWRASTDGHHSGRLRRVAAGGCPTEHPATHGPAARAAGDPMVACASRHTCRSRRDRLRGRRTFELRRLSGFHWHSSAGVAGCQRAGHRRAGFHPCRADLAKPVARQHLRRRRRGGLCGHTSEIRRVCRACRSRAGTKPSRLL